MNREDIIRMAREAGEAEGMVELVFHPVLERFAALVAADYAYAVYADDAAQKSRFIEVFCGGEK